ncbi:hypothetical protein FACS189454_08890 [Planctomycetales bacterium]|nr:hypothetical protein FACS189454_08890 [Planctomycetales bacterium]
MDARHNYLQAEVQTATPQKLQLLLVEAAIKNVHRTKAAWETEKFDVGFETLTRAQDIVAEILSSLDRKNNPDLAGKIASIYVFIFKSMSEAGMTHNPEKLNDALRVLNSERETWKQVCEKFGSSLETTTTTQTISSATQSAVNNPNKMTTITTKSGSLSLSSQASVLVPQKGETKKAGISTATFNRPAGSYASQAKPLSPQQSGSVGAANAETPGVSPAGSSSGTIKTSTYSKPASGTAGSTGKGWDV